MRENPSYISDDTNEDVSIKNVDLDGTDNFYPFQKHKDGERVVVVKPFILGGIQYKEGSVLSRRRYYALGNLADCRS